MWTFSPSEIASTSNSKASSRNSSINISDYTLAFISTLATIYLVIEYEGLVYRQGILASLNFFGLKIPYELILGGLGIILLLEATSRAIGIPLVAIALIFLLFSIFGQKMPDLISHQGFSTRILLSSREHRIPRYRLALPILARLVSPKRLC